MPEVTIKTIDDIDLITLPHQGAYNTIGKTFEKLSIKAGTAGLLGPASRMFAIYYDDPAIVAEADLRSAAGFTPSDALRPAAGAFEPVTITGGHHAVLIHKGPYSDLATSYQWLYGVWLPDSGEEAGDRPCFETYLNDPRETAPPDLLTEIYLPLR